MSDRKECRECGAVLRGAVMMRGLCGKCLVRLALVEAEERSDAEITRLEPPGPQPGERIGPYRILERIGAGGMGVVFRAEQMEPVRRTVALKLIKAGMDTEQVVARFESERQALALMDHPGIARVFDAGATDQGRPYFVMEYVRGDPISTYCDRNRLSTGERLELFIRVCEAVHHAHQKGIIHRDIKPSNVLVTEQDGTPVPKIIDFGVAKATQQRLTERTLFTQLGAMVGTPEYMSPEQAEPSGQDVDTRTDVYSLGVLLYELLVGALPFDPEELRRGAFDEICRRIREEEPSRPSTRLSTLGDASEESARLRGTDRRALTRQLRGDLDWVTMKALAKERNRRYASAHEFAEDVGRHLNHLPVVAGPPSAGYRARKFARRHRWGVAAGALVLSALALGLAGTTYGLVRAMRAESKALQEATAAEQVSEFLVGLFDVSDPSESRGNTITAREILDRGVERIGDDLEEQPGIRARMLSTMGRVYQSLGLLEEAEELLEDAEQTERTLPAAERMKRDTLIELGWARQQLGRYEEAERAFLADYDERKRVLGEDHPLTARSMGALGNLYRILRRLDEAERLLTRAVEIDESILGADDMATLSAKANLAAVYGVQERYEEEAALLEEVLAGFRRAMGPDHVATLTIQRLVALNLIDRGDVDTAERILKEVAEKQRRVLGPDHPRLQETLANLAMLYKNTGRYPEARRYYRESLEIVRRVRGAEHALAFDCLRGIGITYHLEGRHDEAERVLLEVAEGERRAYGPHHPGLQDTLSSLARLYRDSGRYAEARQSYRDSMEIARVVWGEEHPRVYGCLNGIGNTYRLEGLLDDAESTLSDARTSARTALGEHSVVGGAARYLALVHKAQGRLDDADRLQTEALELFRSTLGPEDELTLRTLVELSALKALRGERKHALELLGDAVALGFSADDLADDPDFASLRDAPEFLSLVAGAN